MPNEDHGSFSLGFTFGLLAGAVGFFAFGTERGKNARRQFSQQWHDAHKSLAKNPSTPVTTLKEAYKQVVSAVFDEPQKKKRVAKPRAKRQTFSGT
ncbi:MAG: hypothetical protein GW946_02175 [Candidatus Pacebacteria bacterium]|nr:hypothetical protein [Candidatus Paceibacterota bacterium]PIR60367.1 MAG: hypothetical protein COU67_02325 [Candidatus Pacebacteria bacterium CG10_big_fil_rev_8_21_14_0_10_44_54]